MLDTVQSGRVTLPNVPVTGSAYSVISSRAGLWVYGHDCAPKQIATNNACSHDLLAERNS